MKRLTTGMSGRYRTALCLVFLFCQMSRAEADIYFNVKSNPTAIQNDKVYMSSDLFKQFHQCLCDDTVNVCTANYTLVINRYKVILISSAYLRTVGNNPTIFQCQKPKDQLSLRCERVPEDFGTCLSGSVNFFKLSTSPSCSDTCFGFYWRSDRESFVFNDSDVVACDGCGDGKTTRPTPVTARPTVSSTTTTTTTTTTSTTTTPKPVPDRRTSLSTTATTTTTTTSTITITSPSADSDAVSPSVTTEVTNRSSVYDRSVADAGTDDGDTGAIVGAVVGVVIVIIVVIAIFFVLRRWKASNKHSRLTTDGRPSISSSIGGQTEAVVTLPNNLYNTEDSRHYSSFQSKPLPPQPPPKPKNDARLPYGQSQRQDNSDIQGRHITDRLGYFNIAGLEGETDSSDHPNGHLPPPPPPKPKNAHLPYGHAQREDTIPHIYETKNPGLHYATAESEGSKNFNTFQHKPQPPPKPKTAGLMSGHPQRQDNPEIITPSMYNREVPEQYTTAALEETTNADNNQHRNVPPLPPPKPKNAGMSYGHPQRTDTTDDNIQDFCAVVDKSKSGNLPQQTDV